MKMPSGETPEHLALHQVHALCLGHVEALQDALKDMAQRALTPAECEHLTATDRRLLDQFAYRYTHGSYRSLWRGSAYWASAKSMW